MNKYNNKWTICKSEHKHQSKGESQYCDKLRIMKKGKLISDYITQVKYPIYVCNVLICNHIVDFVIINIDKSKEVHEFKGVKTGVYKLKKKLFNVVYPTLPYIEITKKDL
jgi:hypothetical protein